MKNIFVFYRNRIIWTSLYMRVSNDNFEYFLDSFFKKYGALLTLEDVAEVFKFKTIGAVRKAHARRVLPVDLYRFPNRTGFYAKVEEVAESIVKMEVSKPVESGKK